MSRRDLRRSTGTGLITVFEVDVELGSTGSSRFYTERAEFARYRVRVHRNFPMTARAVLAADDVTEAGLIELDSHRIEIVDETMEMVVEDAVHRIGGCMCIRQWRRDRFDIAIEILRTVEVQIRNQDPSNSSDREHAVKLRKYLANLISIDVL